MKLAITGALGHIGSRFIHSLRPGEFDEVLLVDDLSTQRYASLFELPRGVRVRLVEEDICTADLVTHVSGFDIVVHLAAITHAAESFADKKRVERVNIDGTARVAEACVAANCRLLFASTTSVYGSQAEVVDESCGKDELKPQSPYAESKLRAEELLRAAGRSRQLRAVICRFGTIFGVSKGMRFHTAVNRFIWQAVNDQPLTVWKTALDQRRPYLDLKDAIAAIRFIIEKDLFDNEIYNVLTCNATVGEIVATIRRSIPDLNVDLVDSPIMNQLSYDVADARFRRHGFVPQGDLAKGIEETIRLLRNG
jgi:UDP-glucose 4-epimerase